MANVTLDQNNSEVLQTRVSKDMKKGLKMFCAMNDMTIQQAVNTAITQLITDKPAKSKQVKASSA